MQRFADSGYLCRYALAELSQQPGILEGRQCGVLEVSPLDELAGELCKRLGMAQNHQL